MGIAIVFAMSRLGIALWLVLRLAGLGNLWSITIGFFVGGSVLSIWRRVVRRPA